MQPVFVSVFSPDGRLALAGGALAWPAAAQAQPATLPVVGFLEPASPDGSTPDRLRAFLDGVPKRAM